MLGCFCKHLNSDWSDEDDEDVMPTKQEARWCRVVTNLPADVLACKKTHDQGGQKSKQTTPCDEKRFPCCS